MVATATHRSKSRTAPAGRRAAGTPTPQTVMDEFYDRAVDHYRADCKRAGIEPRLPARTYRDVNGARVYLRDDQGEIARYTIGEGGELTRRDISEEERRDYFHIRHTFSSPADVPRSPLVHPVPPVLGMTVDAWNEDEWIGHATLVGVMGDKALVLDAFGHYWPCEWDEVHAVIDPALDPDWEKKTKTT